MTVLELIEQLHGLNKPDHEVLVVSEPEFEDQHMMEFPVTMVNVDDSCNIVYIFHSNEPDNV